jgi:hypothetical protein
MAPPRRSNKTPKSKKHYKSTAYLSRRLREASLLLKKVFQPVHAEAFLIPNFIIYLEFPPFEPLIITEYPISIYTPEGTRDPMTIFNLFFTTAILRLFIK